MERKKVTEGNQSRIIKTLMGKKRKKKEDGNRASC